MLKLIPGHPTLSMKKSIVLRVRKNNYQDFSRREFKKCPSVFDHPGIMYYSRRNLTEWTHKIRGLDRYKYDEFEPAQRICRTLKCPYFLIDVARWPNKDKINVKLHGVPLPTDTGESFDQGFFYGSVFS